jgi:hypothetical protein
MDAETEAAQWAPCGARWVIGHEEAEKSLIKHSTSHSLHFHPFSSIRPLLQKSLETFNRPGIPKHNAISIFELLT